MAKVKGVSVRLKGALKDGTENIVIQINAGSDRRTIIKTGVSIRPDRFVPDEEWFLLKKAQKGEMSGEEITSAVSEMYNKVTDLILSYEKANFNNWTIAKLKKDLNNKPQSAKFADMMDSFINQKRSHGSYQSLILHQQFIANYCGKTWQTLDCSDIDYNWVIEFREYCKKGNQKHVFKCSASTLRQREIFINATLRLALKNGFLVADQIPYGMGEDKLKISTKDIDDRGDYRIINAARMKELVDYRCDKDSNRNRDWKIFMFQLLTERKLSYKNICTMKKSDLVYRNDEDGVMVQMLRYRQKRNGRDRYIKVIPEMLQILNYLNTYYPSYGDYLFPIIDQECETEEELDRQIYLNLHRYNQMVNKKCKNAINMKGKWDKSKQYDLNYIKSIMNEEFFNNAKLLAKQIFLFSYYAQGLNIADMLCLKYSHIITREKINGTTEHFFKLNRKKTGATIEIKINENLQKIITFFEENEVLFPRVEGYVLPILKDESIFKTDEAEYAFRKNFTTNFNQVLKGIARDLNWPDHIMKSFSSYYARHSFATHLISVGVNASLVKQALGHKDLATTENYIHNIENQVMESKVTEALVS